MEKILFLLPLMLSSAVRADSSETLNRQKRNWVIQSFELKEGDQGPYPITLGKIEVEKTFSFFNIHGQGVEKEPTGILQIGRETGIVTVHGPVDYEKYNVLKLIFQALDRELHVVDTQLGIDIRIIDMNDNAPSFSELKYEETIPEATPQGTTVATVRAEDSDRSQKFKIFDYKIVSVTPHPEDVEFTIKKTHVGTGAISFKGCLNHKKEPRYTLRVAAKEPETQTPSLSNFTTVIINIEDGNNNEPKITGQTGAGRVKEGVENVLVKRLQVADDDSRGTPAWRVKYQIQGEANNNFWITTDSETNEGLLFVNKSLNYETSQLETVTISVENEIPFSHCRVKSRTGALWSVVTTQQTQLATSTVEVIVEDVNESPVFNPTFKRVTVSENSAVGLYLEMFTATDPDVASRNKITYRVGQDVAGWIKVDAETGKITTMGNIDRESDFVVNSIYNATILAIDDGQPPMTSTATLYIHIKDENDNAPTLATSVLDICQTDGISKTEITASDLDADPYGGPFTFQLQDQEKGKWSIDPTQGYTVNLVKEPGVHSGDYKLQLEVFDVQGGKAVHNLSVTVCTCSNPEKPNCRIRRAAGSSLNGAAFAVILVCLLLLAALLLLGLVLSCKEKSIVIHDDGAEPQIMKCNIETPGTDCEMVFEPKKGYSKLPQTQITECDFGGVMTKAQSEHAINKKGMKYQQNTYINQTVTDSLMVREFMSGNTKYGNAKYGIATYGNAKYGNATYGNATYGNFNQKIVKHGSVMLGTSANQSVGGFSRRSSMRASSIHSRYFENQRASLQKVLHQRLLTLQTPGEELGDYAPRVYAVEGNSDADFKLDAISIPDGPFDPDLDLDLDFRFNTLASICMPTDSSVSEIKTPPKRLGGTFAPPTMNTASHLYF